MRHRCGGAVNDKYHDDSIVNNITECILHVRHLEILVINHLILRTTQYVVGLLFSLLA